MRVAWVVPGGVDRSGEVRVIPCLLGLMKRVARVHDLHVFALRQEPRPCRFPLLGATVHNMGMPFPVGRLVMTLWREHRVTPFDVFHVFWGGKHSAAVTALARRLRRPALLHLAGGELISLRNISYGGQRTWARRLLMDFSLRNASCVTAAASALIAEGAALGIEIRRLVLGVDLQTWPVRPPMRRHSEMGRLIHVGTLNRVKDQRTLVHAMGHLRDLGLPFHLNVVGEDTLDGEIQALARSLQLRDYVSFHGFLRHHELRPLVDQSDLLIVSSRHEGGELVTLEAAVAGVPTVGTDVGHVSGLAPRGAVAVPVSDARSLALAIGAILRDETRRLSVSAEAQRFATTHDADATAGQVLAMYQEWASRENMASGVTGGAPPVHRSSADLGSRA